MRDEFNKTPVSEIVSTIEMVLFCLFAYQLALNFNPIGLLPMVAGLLIIKFFYKD